MLPGESSTRAFPFYVQIKSAVFERASPAESSLELMTSARIGIPFTPDKELPQ